MTPEVNGITKVYTVLDKGKIVVGYKWCHPPVIPDLSIKVNDNVSITTTASNYELIAHLYSLRPGPVTDTLALLGGDNRLHNLSPAAYYEARHKYLQDYGVNTSGSPLVQPTSGSCTHRKTEKVEGGCLVTLYSWKRCLDCGGEA